LIIINESTVAVLAYGLGTKKKLSDSLVLTIIKKDNIKDRKILVFDLRGGTFDITIVIHTVIFRKPYLQA
jgi:molecular chaperone DnaK (HSP70)